MVNLQVIVPAHDEECFITPCLSALIDGYDHKSDTAIEIVVVANACSDKTAENALKLAEAAAYAGISLRIIETSIAGKAHAINLAEDLSDIDVYIYVDADVVCDFGMINALAQTLQVHSARFASGQIVPDCQDHFFSKCYKIVWSNLPFIKNDVSGCGIYAVNATGRRRWAEFPQIHSDDKFVRLHFTPAERFKVNVDYNWPLPKSFSGLVAVRSRWCRGNYEIARRFPQLLTNDESQNIAPLWALSLVIKHPLSSTIFILVYFAAKLRALIHEDGEIVHWERSR